MLKVKQDVMQENKLIYQVDAFTTEPFLGNPAGVCLPGKEMSREWMQNFAAEMNLSETAFLWKGDGNWNIRYFTPTSEIPLCGHATLSSAHIMFSTGMVGKNETIIFSQYKHQAVLRWLYLSNRRLCLMRHWHSQQIKRQQHSDRYGLHHGLRFNHRPIRNKGDSLV